MGLMVDGAWQPDRESEPDDADGAFERLPTTFRDWVRQDGAYPPEASRYHLYIARACPWAHRTTILRRLKGLEDVISVDVVDPIRINDGWEFSPEKPGCTPDTVNGFSYLREVYRAADPAFTGKVSVPVLWDREAETIVNNESSEIIQILDTAFDMFAARDIRLFPDDLPVVDRIEEIYEPINNGVYKAGFARTQAAYEEAVAALFEALHYWDEKLADQRYLCGERLTAADICLFTTLYRFDEVYHTHFKCNRVRLTDFAHLWGHTREIYQLPGVKATCNMRHCKQHYYRSHTSINPSQLVPVGPDPAFATPHGRDRLPGAPPASLVEAA